MWKDKFVIHHFHKTAPSHERQKALRLCLYSSVSEFPHPLQCLLLLYPHTDLIQAYTSLVTHYTERKHEAHKPTGTAVHVHDFFRCKLHENGDIPTDLLQMKSKEEIYIEDSVSFTNCTKIFFKIKQHHNATVLIILPDYKSISYYL